MQFSELVNRHTKKRFVVNSTKSITQLNRVHGKQYRPAY